MGTVERVARVLCVAAGEEPERRLREFRTSHTYPAWEEYRVKALEIIALVREELEL
jgi:hypothetical protein